MRLMAGAGGAALGIAIASWAPLPADAGTGVAMGKAGGFSKPAFGVLKRAEAGDVACYLTLSDDRGAAFVEMADFRFCEPDEARRLKGKRVALTYEIGDVLAAECGGDMDCGKHERAAIIHKVTVVGPLLKK